MEAGRQSLPACNTPPDKLFAEVSQAQTMAAFDSNRSVANWPIGIISDLPGFTSANNKMAYSY